MHNHDATGHYDIDEGIPQKINWFYQARNPFVRGDSGYPKPYWSVLQALAWIASGSHGLVKHIGNIEGEEFGPLPPKTALGQLLKLVSDQFCECGGKPEIEQAWWEHCSCSQSASRSLFEAIYRDDIKPVDSQNRSRMKVEDFVSLDLRQSCADWLDIEPTPKFLSADVIEKFPINSKLGQLQKSRAEGPRERLPRLPQSTLRRWWEGLSPEQHELTQEALWSLCRDAHKDNQISRQRIRDLTSGRKRGPKPLR